MPKSLWLAWPSLREKIAGARELALFLDYDGTLTPIVKHPSRARLAAGMRQLLRKLAAQPGIWVALVSGRELGELRRMVRLPRLCYVGNHGLELHGPKMRYLNPVARRSRPVMRRIAGALRSEIRGVKGAWVEDKGLSLSAHFRGVEPAEKILVRNGFYRVVRPYQEKGRVCVTSGKEVFEVRPPVRWDKGRMVRWLLARREAMTGQEVLPAYVGDDLTDEDAFEALGRRGITVAVGPGTPLTRAGYVVRSPLEVKRLLELILEARRAR